jgi:hypothetical protein
MFILSVIKISVMQNNQSGNQLTQKTGSDKASQMDQNASNDKKVNMKSDLKDSPADSEKLKSETVTIEMPEVKDIPGQENITVPDMREMQDVTISSADEEADELLNSLDNESETEAFTSDSDVSEEEQRQLRRAAGHPANAENRDLAKISLDSTDADGDELSEKGAADDRFGEDLDVPGSEADDDNEDIGAEDEENNAYSRPD